MTTLNIELPPDLYRRLQDEAERAGKAADVVAQEWLIQWLQAPVPSGERERSREVLRAAGLLAELSPEEKALAAQSTLTLEEARAILDRAGGKPLSEIILEMRGPKE